MKRFGRMLMLIFLACPVLAREYLDESMALKIGVKVWYNESGGKVAGLTSWVKGESFASMGIGHFIWYPKNVTPEHGESFAKLLRYLDKHGINLPDWLREKQGHYCPWSDRDTFRKQAKSDKMNTLRILLVETIPLQAQYMVLRLAETIPSILNQIPSSEREAASVKFNQLMTTPKGVFALVDYLNFKGGGLGNKHHDWGLLQVMRQMLKAPENLSSIEAFVWAADVVLARRVLHAAQDSHQKEWLNGWHHRVYSYL